MELPVNPITPPTPVDREERYYIEVWDQVSSKGARGSPASVTNSKSARTISCTQLSPAEVQAELLHYARRDRMQHLFDDMGKGAEPPEDPDEQLYLLSRSTPKLKNWRDYQEVEIFLHECQTHIDICASRHEMPIDLVITAWAQKGLPSLAMSHWRVYEQRESDGGAPEMTWEKMKEFLRRQVPSEDARRISTIWRLMDARQADGQSFTAFMEEFEGILGNLPDTLPERFLTTWMSLCARPEIRLALQYDVRGKLVSTRRDLQDKAMVVEDNEALEQAMAREKRMREDDDEGTLQPGPKHLRRSHQVGHSNRRRRRARRRR